MPEFTPEKARAVGEEIGIQWDEVEFDSEALAAGMNVELEHGIAAGDADVTQDDPETTAKIAWVHLQESPDYYTMLATIEEEFETAHETEDQRARASRVHCGYTRTPSPQREKAPLTSQALQKLTQDYLRSVVRETESGVSADDAFRQLPDLGNLGPDDLVDLLRNNPRIASRRLDQLGEAVQYGDVYDVIQLLLQRFIWESAVQWWGKRQTQEQDAQQAAEQAAQRDETETVVLEKPKAAKLIRYLGYTYREQDA